jgi:hypothetical protein
MLAKRHSLEHWNTNLRTWQKWKLRYNIYVRKWWLERYYLLLHGVQK